MSRAKVVFRVGESVVFKNCSQKLLKTLREMTCKNYRCRLVHAKRYAFSETCVSSTRNTTFSPQSGRGFVAGLLLRSAAWPFGSLRTESQKFMSASCRRNAYFFSPAKSEGHPNSSINLKARPAHKFLCGRCTCAVRGSYCQHSALIPTETTPFETQTVPDRI